MVSYDMDQRPILREAVYCDMSEGRTRVTNYSGNFIILPKTLRSLWDGIIEQMSVEELTNKHLVANFSTKNDESKEQATKETFELLSLLSDRRIISMGYMPLWESMEQEG